MQQFKQGHYNQTLTSINKYFSAFKINKKNSLRKTRIRRSILNALIRGDLNYRLTKEDMRYVAQIKYNNFNLLSANDENNKLEILESLLDLFYYDIEKFKSNPDKNKKLTLFIKLNNEDLNESYWSTLVVTGELTTENNFVSYYTNVKNRPLHSDSFHAKNIHINNIDLNTYSDKNIENYNSGLWALECANYIHTMLNDNLDMYWLHEKIGELNEDSLIKMGEDFVKSTQENPIYIERHKNFISHQDISNLYTYDVVKKSSDNIEPI